MVSEVMSSCKSLLECSEEQPGCSEYTSEGETESSNNVSDPDKRQRVEGLAEDENENGSTGAVDWINHLPDELLIEILSYLDPRSLVHVAGNVSKRWHRIAEDEVLWRQMELEIHDTDDIEEAYEFLKKVPALRKLTIWGSCPTWPFVGRMPAIQELILKGSSGHDADRPDSPDSYRVCHFSFSIPNMLPQLGQTLERLTVLGEVAAEQFRYIDQLDLRELRMVSDELRDFPCCNRPRRREMEYVHFENDGNLCYIPRAMLRIYKNSLRTVVGRVDLEGMKEMATCTNLEAADIDVPSVASLAYLDGLQSLHTLRVSFRRMNDQRPEALPDDRVHPLLPHFSQRIRRLSIYQIPSTEVLASSLSDVLNRYKDHLECLEIGRICFRQYFHGIEVMRVIDQMTNLKVLFLGSSGWPNYPLSLKHLEVLRADIYRDWITTCLENSQKSLKKVICDNIPEIVCEQWLSQCNLLEETVIDLEALHTLNSLGNLRALTLQFPVSSSLEMLETGRPLLSQITALTAEAIRGTSCDEEILAWLGANCLELKSLYLRGWGQVVAFGHWLSHFSSIEQLTLDLTLPFYQNLIHRLIDGAVPNLKSLVFEDQEGESGVSSALEKLQEVRPHLQIMGSWSEAEPLTDEEFPANNAVEEGIFEMFILM